jgi:hypothetical protein
MTRYSDWQEMKRKAFDAYLDDGVMSVEELEQIVDIGCADGDFDEREKEVLVSVIAGLTPDDMTDEMWLKVDDLIHKFKLNEISAAFVEHQDEEE